MGLTVLAMIGGEDTRHTKGGHEGLKGAEGGGGGWRRWWGRRRKGGWGGHRVD